MNCPKCQLAQIIKYGHTHYGKPRFRCQDCSRQFVENATRQPVDETRRQLIDKLLLLRLALAAIARVTGVSERWLQMYINQKYYQTLKTVEVAKKKPGRLTIQLDELWSFVTRKENKQWVWLALDADTREIVGVYVGDRSRALSPTPLAVPAFGVPESFRGEDSPRNTRCQCALCYTDFWEAYQQVLPSRRHQAVGKKTGKTSYIERFNNTLRQRVGRLVRKTLSFSKKLSNHIGAIWNFVHHYNIMLRI